MPATSNSANTSHRFEHFTPAFFQEAGVAPTSDAGPAPDWSYRQEVHGLPEAFTRHADYEKFRESFQADIQTLCRLVDADPTACARLRTFRDNVLTVRNDGTNPAYGDTAAQIYGRSARCLAKLARDVNEQSRPRDACIETVREIAEQITACAHGAAYAIESLLGRLEADQLQGSFRVAAERVIEQTAVEAVNAPGSLVFTGYGNHRHSAAGVIRQLYARHGIDWRLPEDRLAPDRVPESVLAKCSHTLQRTLTPARLTEQMAERYLSSFADAQRSAHLAGRAPTIDDFESFAAPLQVEFGPPPPWSVLVDLDDAGDCSPRTDALPLALHFVDRLRESGQIDDAHRPRHIGTWTETTQQEGDGAVGVSRTLMGLDHLRWFESSDGQRSLTAADVDRALASAPLDLMPTLVDALLEEPPGETGRQVPYALLQATKPGLASPAELRALFARVATDGGASVDVLRRLREALLTAMSRYTVEERLLMDEHPESGCPTRLTWPVADWFDAAARITRSLPPAVGQAALRELILEGPDGTLDGAPIAAAFDVEVPCMFRSFLAELKKLTDAGPLTFSDWLTPVRRQPQAWLQLLASCAHSYYVREFLDPVAEAVCAGRLETGDFTALVAPPDVDEGLVALVLRTGDEASARRRVEAVTDALERAVNVGVVPPREQLLAILDCPGTGRSALSACLEGGHNIDAAINWVERLKVFHVLRLLSLEDVVRAMTPRESIHREPWFHRLDSPEHVELLDGLLGRVSRQIWLQHPAGYSSIPDLDRALLLMLLDTTLESPSRTLQTLRQRKPGGNDLFYYAWHSARSAMERQSFAPAVIDLVTGAPY